MADERIRDYYLEKDNNCAETTLHIINDKYGLNLSAEDFKLVGAFGAGFGCGITCGALCGAMAALGRMTITDRAHGTEGFKDLCADYVKEFRAKMACTDCEKIKETNFHEDGTRCICTVEGNAELFDEFVKAHGLAVQKG
ncbi:MAG: C-GCAxxG-C-C family (seleno)protein [Oscillospiraceae bacterium]